VRRTPGPQISNLLLSESIQNSLQFGVSMEELKRLIREVPDFPKPGILFYDITTLLKDAEGFRSVIDGLRGHYQNAHVDTVLGIEARGFIFAPALAYALGSGFVPVRKPKKLPAECVSVTYDLEYGSDSLEMHKDAIGKGHRVLIVDDLLATGGTAAAAARMVENVGGAVAGIGFVVELTFLNGRQKLPGRDVFSLLQYNQ
jgi:adenine phosphoribosyltransferase